MTSTTRLLSLLAAASIAGCGGGDYADSGGGNVGFGGAQDIGQFREILDEGGIPGPNTLDANGFFSEHYIELPAPDCGQILCGHAMVSVGRDWIGRDYQAALQIAMNTPIDPADLVRKPLNMVVVVDTSGSMSDGDRIGFARQGLHLLVDNLEEGDRLGLIEYNSGVTVMAELGAVDRETLHTQIDGLRAGGSTNLYGGLEVGLTMVADNFDAERQNRVVLLSDGQPTAGITGGAAIVSMAEGYIGDGIGLTTIGVGTSFNVDLMRSLAERGAGNFYFLEDAAAVTEVFVDELDYFVEPLALDVRIEAVAGPSYTIGEVVGTKLWHAEGATGGVEIPAVFVASRTSAEPDPNGRRGGGSTIIARMEPRSSGTSIDPRKVAEIVLSYRLSGSDERIVQTIEVDNPHDPGTSPEDAWFSHQAMAKNYATYNVYLGLRSATLQADAGDYHCALGVLEAIGTSTRAWNQTYEDPDLAADLVLIDRFAGNLRQAGAWASEGAPLEACNSDYDPYDDPYYGGDDYGDDVIYGCSASNGGAGGATVLLGLALLGAAARRKRG